MFNILCHLYNIRFMSFSVLYIIRFYCRALFELRLDPSHIRGRSCIKIIGNRFDISSSYIRFIFISDIFLDVLITSIIRDALALCRDWHTSLVLILIASVGTDIRIFL